MSKLQPIPSPAQILAARKALNKTQETLARIIGVTHATYNRWERGHCEPMPVFREKLWKLIDLGKKHSREG